MDNDSTGKPARLSLAQRAACGLPIDLSRKAGLDIDDVCWLEHTDDAAQQARLCAKLETAIGLYPRLARPFSIGGCPAGWLIRRSAYRAWRTARSPSSLLSETSDIALWLGATPTAESIPPAETSLPEKWLGATPGPEPAESIPPVETSLPELPGPARPKKRQRIDAISDAIRAALPVLSPSGAYPRPHELFDYLAKNDSTRTITGLANGNRALLWKDNNGNEQRLTFSALVKRLDRIRQGG